MKDISCSDISDNSICLNDEVKLIATLITNENGNQEQESALINDSDSRSAIINALRADMKEIEQKMNQKIAEDSFTVRASDLSLETKKHRGGKYNKRIAPLPPLCDNQTNTTIKATLVLKPGLLKAVGYQSPDSRRSEVFVQSPKLKRKISKSPSPSRLKNDSTFTKLLMFSKRMGVRFKELDSNSSKRKSWHDILQTGSAGLQRQQSKSDDNISNVQSRI